MLNTTTWNRLRYSLYAPFYDLVIARAFRRARRLALDGVHWRQGQRVLLIGAGTGLDLPCLPRDIEVHAIDISPMMITRLEARAERHGLDIIAATMDAARLAYPDAHFDVVVMHLIVAVMPDPEAGLREAHRVLVSDGQLCVMDKFQSDARPAGWSRRLVNVVTSFLATDITRQARPLLEGNGFLIEHDTPVMMGSLFRALLARKA